MKNFRFKLLNSAVMPQEGKYTARRLTKEEFGQILVQAQREGKLDSYIGYPNNIDLIKQWFGVDVPLNRDQTKLNDRDVMLVMKLKYRLANPSDKGKHQPDPDDFEFFIIHYRSDIYEEE